MLSGIPCGAMVIGVVLCDACAFFRLWRDVHWRELCGAVRMGAPDVWRRVMVRPMYRASLRCHSLC